MEKQAQSPKRGVFITRLRALSEYRRVFSTYKDFLEDQLLFEGMSQEDYHAALNVLEIRQHVIENLEDDEFQKLAARPKSGTTINFSNVEY